MVYEAPDAGLRRQPQPGGYLPPILQVLLSAYDRYVLHAAAVAHNDAALLFLGDSGMGKTTIAVQLARDGLAYMGDDLILISTGPQGAIAHALLMKPRMAAGASEGKRVSNMLTKEGILLCRKAPVRGLVSLTRNDEALRTASRSSSDEAYTWLLRQGNHVRLFARKQPWLDTIAGAATRAPAWRWSPRQPNSANIHYIREEALRLIGYD
jgi:hypothetical protein